MKTKAVFLIVLSCFTASLFAGEGKRGESGFMFLKVPIGARATSMGMTGLTTTSGAEAIYWNPANMAYNDRPNATLSYLSYVAGINSSYGAFSMPVGDVGVLGFSLNYFGYGNIEVTTEEYPDGTGAKYNPYEMAIGVSYAKQVTDRVSGGFTVKFLSSSIHLVSASAVAFDFGFSYAIDYRNMKLGFAISNIGNQARYEGEGLIKESNVNPNAPGDGGISFLRFGNEPFELPASVSFGLSMDIFRDEQHSVVGVMEQNVNSFQSNRTNFGVEYGFKNMFFLRGGYTSALKKNTDYNTSGGSSMAGLSAGAGFDYKFNDRFETAIDYGYFNMGILDANHRVTVSLKF